MITITRLDHCRKPFMAWMREAQYQWWIIHADHMADTMPRFAPMAPDFSESTLSFGSHDVMDKGQAPPKGICWLSITRKDNKTHATKRKHANYLRIIQRVKHKIR